MMTKPMLRRPAESTLRAVHLSVDAAKRLVDELQDSAGALVGQLSSSLDLGYGRRDKQSMAIAAVHPLDCRTGRRASLGENP